MDFANLLHFLVIIASSDFVKIALSTNTNSDINCSGCITKADQSKKYYRQMKIKHRLQKELGYSSSSQRPISNSNTDSPPEPVKAEFYNAMLKPEGNDEKKEQAVYIAREVGSSRGSKTIFQLKVPRRFFKRGGKVSQAKICVPGRYIVDAEASTILISYGETKRNQSGMKFRWKVVVTAVTRENDWQCFTVTKLLLNVDLLRRSRLGSMQLQEYVHISFQVKKGQRKEPKSELPYLLIATVDKIAKRRRRGGDCKSATRRSCCRESLPINFADIGLGDLIVTPTHFDAHICKGKCRTFSMHTSDRVEILKKFNFNFRGKKNLDPVNFCCSATNSRALPIMFKDGDSFIVKEVKDLIITECGCV